MDKLQKRYGLLTAICMVVGIVIGSGVFFKAQTILQKTGGNMPLGILAWIIGGVIMLTCLLAFSVMAQKFEKVNGIVDYAEACVGSKYAYYVGWFLTIIYYPCLTSVLSWLSARYTLVFITSIAPDFPLLGLGAAAGAETVLGPECMSLAMFYMCCVYAVNALSPKLAGKLQVSATIIKLIPLFLMAIVGIVVGLANGTLANNFNTLADVGTTSTNPLFASVCATAFAYEGWIIATSINSELHDAKRNLPIALILGALFCTVLYCLYIFAMSSVGDVQTIIGTWPLGESLPRIAFSNIFGKTVGTIVYAFISIGCLGVMNGLIMGSCRGMYSVAARGMGPRPEFYGDIDHQNGFTMKSAIIGMMLGGFWYAWTAVIWMYGPDFMGGLHDCQWIAWEPDEICIINLYAMYIPMFIALIVKDKGGSVIKRYVLPILGLCCCVFMCYCCWVGKGYKQVLGYLAFFAVVMFIGKLFKGKRIEAEVLE